MHIYAGSWDSAFWEEGEMQWPLKVHIYFDF